MKMGRALFTITVLALAAAAFRPAAAQLMSADCINCTRTPSGEIVWTSGVGATDVGWPYVPPSSFDLAEIQTNFAAGFGGEQTVTAEIFQGVPGQPGATLLGSATFSSSVAQGTLGGAPFASPIPLVQGQQYFIGFRNVAGLGINVDADNDFRGASSDPDDTTDTCDAMIPADPSCDADGAALRLLGSPSLGGLHIDTDGSGSFVNVDNDRAPVALDAPIIALLAPANAAPTATPTATTEPELASCPGDCNANGKVAVNEIIILVNIILGSAQPTACSSGIPTGASVNVAFVIRAVNAALNGCVSSETPTPTPTATPGTPGASLAAAAAVGGRTTIAVDAVSVISNVVAAIATGVQFGGSAASPAAANVQDPGGQAAGACPLGGTATKSGSLFTGGESVTLTGCTVATSDGTVTFDGHGIVGLFTGLMASVTATFKDMTGMTIEVASADVMGPASASLGGNCTITGATLTVSGTLSAQITGGPTVKVTFSDTNLTISNIVFDASCVPTVYDLTLSGQAALLGPSGGSEDVTFNQLAVHVDSSGNPTMLTVNGGMDSSCFGGSVMLATQTALSIPSHQDCPTAGVIVATFAQGQATITFEPDQSVMIEGGASGNLTAPNCLDPRLLVCAA